MNLGNATGHPSRIMDGSFANQVLAQIHLYEKRFADLSSEDQAGAICVEVLPKHLDEQVATDGRRVWRCDDPSYRAAR